MSPAHTPPSRTESLAWNPVEERRYGYGYDKLLHHDSMRLLTLLPNDIEATELCYELELVEMSKVEDTYEAISYVWSHPEHSVKTTCNGEIAFITVNLAEALQATRDPEKPKRLWADAICINQRNHEEKGHQVRKMGNVYQNAKRVLVWLGVDDDGIANECFNLIRESNGYMDSQLEKYDGDYRNISTLVEPYPICSDRSKWATVKELVALPWFSRIWVIQEAGLAKECILLWGRHQMPLAHLVEFVLWKTLREDLSELTGITGMGFLNDVFSDVQCTYENVKTWRKSLPLIAEETRKSTGRKNLFLDTLVAGTGLGAFDDRDRVYALLGSPLARTAEGHLLVEPDYDKSVSEVFFDTACALLKLPREAPFVLTRVKHHHSSDLFNSSFPSWVPRWDTGLIPFLIARIKFWFQAGGSSTFNYEIRPNNHLAFRGICFDRVAWVSRVLLEHNFRFSPDEWDDEFRKARKPFIDVLWEDVLRVSKSATSSFADQEKSDFETEFSYTLVRGYPADTEHKISLAQHQTEFEAYRQFVRHAAQSKSKSKGEETEEELIFPRNFLHRIYYSAGLRLIITESNRLGLVSAITEPGDECFVIPGISVPMILRSRSKSPHNPHADFLSKEHELEKRENFYSLIGEAYINGVMAGEVIDQVGEGKLAEKHGLIV